MCGSRTFVACVAAHQRVGKVVDVLGGAGEVHELDARLPGRMCAELLLDQVLDGLDVVIGLALERLDRGGVGRVEAVGDAAGPRRGRPA